MGGGSVWEVEGEAGGVAAISREDGYIPANRYLLWSLDLRLTSPRKSVKAKCLSFSWLQTQLAKGLFDFQEAMQRMSKIYLPIEARVWSGQRRTLDAGQISTRLWVTNCDQSSRVTFATDRCKSTKEFPLKWHLNEWFCNILGKLLKWQPN